MACAPVRPASEPALDGGWLGRMPTAAPMGRPTAGTTPDAPSAGMDLRLDEPRARDVRYTGRTWLGVELGTAPGGGVLVKAVVRRSPAAKAGVLAGDLVLEVDGTAVRAPRELQREVGSHAPGDTCPLTVRRAGADLVLEAELGRAPAPGETARLELVGVLAPELGVLEPVGDAFPTALAGLRGHVVLVDFWASWCVPCRIGVGALARYHTRFGERGLRVLGVADDALPEAAAAARDWAIPYPVAADPSQRTQGAYHIDVLPTLVVIDKRGVVREVVSGYSPAETAAVGALVERLLAEPG